MKKEDFFFMAFSVAFLRVFLISRELSFKRYDLRSHSFSNPSKSDRKKAHKHTTNVRVTFAISTVTLLVPIPVNVLTVRVLWVYNLRAYRIVNLGAVVYLVQMESEG